MDKIVKWGVPTVLPDGHRMFPRYTESLNHVALADNSGREPQDTDDGILWLNKHQPLMIISNNDRREAFMIPLISEAGEETRTCSDASTLLLLAALFNWPIVDMRNNAALYAIKER